LPAPNKSPYDLHTVHQRTLDDLQRPGALLPGLLGVGLDLVGDAVDERVRQPLGQLTLSGATKVTV
jgi:hypothetical protein